MCGKCRVWVLVAAVLFVSLPLGIASGEGAAVDMAALAAEYEPGPYGDVSLQETQSFAPVAVGPWAVMEKIDRCQSVEETRTYVQGLGLPLDDLDCEYLYHYKMNGSFQQFPMESDALAFDAVAAVSYTYAEEKNDNIVLLFTGEDGVYHLTDCLYSFGNIQLVTSAACDAAWLVGDTGRAYQTTRWYDVPNRRIALRYLAQGTLTDRADFHVTVQSQGEPILNGQLPADGLYAVFKQFGIVDFTTAESDAQAAETVLYTQISVYRAQPEGSFALLLSKPFDGLALRDAAAIDWRKLLEAEGR